MISFRPPRPCLRLSRPFEEPDQQALERTELERKMWVLEERERMLLESCDRLLNLRLARESQ